MEQNGDKNDAGTASHYPRNQKRGKHSDGICGLCKRCREMGLGLLGGNPAPRARSACKDWDFVSKGTEISVGRFFIEYLTPLTLGEQHQGTLSDEDVTEVWLAAKSEAISKVRRTKGGAKGADIVQIRRECKRPSGSVGPMAGCSTRKRSALSPS
jgi:hypothetical protein